MKLWDGRFRKSADRLMDEFNNSLPFDKTLVAEDIVGSIAWARALGRIGVLSARERAKIEAGLRAVGSGIQKGSLAFLSTDEDIHMAVERLLTERIGAAGAKLHTGRSRNDQVATDTRLFVKRSLAGIAGALAGLQRELVARAKKDFRVIVPAFTHLQQAQPVLLAHYWLSFFFVLDREQQRVARAERAKIARRGRGRGKRFPGRPETARRGARLFRRGAQQHRCGCLARFFTRNAGRHRLDRHHPFTVCRRSHYMVVEGIRLYRAR